MQVIGVLDLLGGRAVHARAGRRDRYEPVRLAAGAPVEPGDATALARAYRDQLGITELYTADLDAILARLGEPDPPRPLEAPASPATGIGTGRGLQEALVTSLAGLGLPLWLDSGVSSVDEARAAISLGAARVVVGLETLTSFETLAAICSAVDGDRVAFSLDLRNGQPVRGDRLPAEPPHAVAARAAEARAGTLIVIDLARVGMGEGPDLALLSRVREAAPRPRLFAGGGVRGFADLERLAAAGCEGALVATALHEGKIGAADVAASRLLPTFRPRKTPAARSPA